MKIICDKCEYVIDRDKYVEGELVEEYTNVYGTICPNCNCTIKPFKKPFISWKNEKNMDLLKEEMREKLRKNIKGEM